MLAQRTKAVLSDPYRWAKGICLSVGLSLFSVNALAQVQQLHGFAAEDIEASVATGVNPAGQIAGVVSDHDGKKHAVLYDGRLLRLRVESYIQICRFPDKSRQHRRQGDVLQVPSEANQPKRFLDS